MEQLLFLFQDSNRYSKQSFNIFNDKYIVEQICYIYVNTPKILLLIRLIF